MVRNTASSSEQRPAQLEYAPHMLRPPWWRSARLILWGAVTLVGAFLAWSVAAPLLTRTTCGSLREACRSNMCQIGEGIAMYANNHAGRFPDDLESLFINQDLTTGAFVCPSSSNTPAPIAPTTQATAAGLRQPGHCSYIYLGNGLTDHTATPDMVLLYEPLSNHALSAQGMNVLFGDFRVEWLPASDAQVILNQVAARTSPVRFPTTAPAPNAK